MAVGLILSFALTSVGWSNPLPIDTPAVHIQINGDAANWENAQWVSSPDGKTIQVFYWGDLYDDSFQAIDFNVDLTFVGKEEPAFQIQWLIDKVGDETFNPPKLVYLKEDLSVKADENTVLSYGLTAGAEKKAGLKLTFIPVNFEVFEVEHFEDFDEEDSGEMEGIRAPNWEPHKLNMNTKMNEEQHYNPYKKCVAAIWGTAELDLAKYLTTYVQNKELFENPELVKWRVTEVGSNPVTQGKHTFGLGAAPAADEVKQFRVELLFAEGNIVTDRLIITVVPESTLTSFRTWVTDEGDFEPPWWDDLPFPYSSLADEQEDPESDDADCSLWMEPEDQNSFYHPGSSFEMRSQGSLANNPAHQACFDAGGQLIRTGISAGSADRAAPRGLRPWRHLNLDVKPFVWAAQLDGSPVQGSEGEVVDFLNLTQPILFEGAFLAEYLRWRPSVIDDQVLAPGFCRLEEPEINN